MIRTLRSSELTSLLDLYRDLHDQDEPVPNEKALDVWQAILENGRDTCFGKFIGKDLVASCTITITPNLTRGCRSYGVIENVVTSRKHRRKGYGREVLKCALSHAWDHNCYKVMLMTGRMDDGIYRFYESVGFRRDEKVAFLAKPSSCE